MATKEMATTADGRLTELANMINASHKKFEKSFRGAVEHARDAGTTLLEVKGMVEADGGSLDKWVQDHCEFKVRTAQRYMQIADRYNELRDSGKTLVDLSLSRALALLAGGPEKAGPNGGKAPAEPFKVPSKVELNKVTREASSLKFTDDSSEKRFVDATLKEVVRRVLAQVRKNQTGTENQMTPASLAVALVAELKKGLENSLVITVAEATPQIEVPASGAAKTDDGSEGTPEETLPQNRAKDSHSARKPNGKPTIV